MRAPVTGCDLVADQGIAGRIIGYAHQSFRQAHQCDALLAGERIFLDQPFDATATALFAHARDQIMGGLCNRLALGIGNARLVEQWQNAIGLGTPIGSGNRTAQRCCG